VEALRLRDVDRVFEEIDLVCAAQGARTCLPLDLENVGPEVRDRVTATWRQLYPRVMAVHAEALVITGTRRDGTAAALHSGVLLRLAARCDEIARRADAPMTIASLAATGRHLVLWALQYVRDEWRLGDALDILDRAKFRDVDVWLARGALAELRTRPGAIAAAVRAYREGIEVHPEVPELHLRLGRVLAVLDRLDEADRHLAKMMTLRPDPRQSYLTALFLGDLRERQRRPEDAMAAYASALEAWPGAQAPVVALARLRVLTGAADAGRATLAGVHVERDMRERSDPWLGYAGGQGWRLSGALADLQRTFEPLQ
jgi:tetratricopeptide (TPR) repeat protein